MAKINRPSEITERSILKTVLPTLGLYFKEYFGSKENPDTMLGGDKCMNKFLVEGKVGPGKYIMKKACPGNFNGVDYKICVSFKVEIEIGK